MLESKAVHEIDSNINPGDLVDTDEAAKIIGVSRYTLPTWRHYGKGPKFCKIGRSVRYYKPHLLEYIRDNCRASTSQS